MGECVDVKCQDIDNIGFVDKSAIPGTLFKPPVVLKCDKLIDKAHMYVKSTGRPNYQMLHIKVNIDNWRKFCIEKGLLPQ